jgi:hypothetical protein
MCIPPVGLSRKDGAAPDDSAAATTRALHLHGEKVHRRNVHKLRPS